MISQVRLASATGNTYWFHEIGVVTPVKNPLRTRMFAWWYFTIAGGFLLLAINRWLLGQRAGLVLAQFVAAAAFVLFGWMAWDGRS